MIFHITKDFVGLWQLMLTVTLHTDSVTATASQEWCCYNAIQQLQTSNIVYARGSCWGAQGVRRYPTRLLIHGRAFAQA